MLRPPLRGGGRLAPRRTGAEGEKLKPDKPDAHRIRDLFTEALARDPDARTGYLVEACAGNEEIRQKVEALLRLASEAGTAFLERPLVPANGGAANVRATPDPTGHTIGHFDVGERIGKGGMGVVHRATDRRLRRTVALKFLDVGAHLGSESRQRFLREARAAAALDHPSIGTIHDIGDWEEQPYIVMSYYEGMTLAARIAAERMPIREIETTLGQIAAGLEAAHGAGVVHRDLKPGNVLVTRTGQIKILDFGLAKLLATPVPAPTSERLSSTGVVMGTVDYMSPEQARAEEVDHRTDLWALGVIAYEMLTGTRPFRGESAVATLASIMVSEPRPARELRPDAPPYLLDLTASLLRKEREERPSSARAVVEALVPETEPPITAPLPGAAPTPAGAPAPTSAEARSRTRPAALALLLVGLLALAWSRRVPSPPPAPDVPEPPLSIAVADVVNETGASELDGLSGMLSTALEQSRKVSVVTRARMVSQLGAMGQPKDSRIDEELGLQICRESRTGALVVATVRRFDEVYSVDLKVVTPDRHDYLFTAKEEGKGKASIPGQIDRLSERTRLALRERRADITASSAPVASVTTPNLEAYQHYFLGEQRLAANLDALPEYEKAVELDPTFAAAWYMVAQIREYFVAGSGADAMARARELADRAPEKERFLILARDAELRQDFVSMVSTYEEMLVRYPDERSALYGLGAWLMHERDYEGAARKFRRVIELGPDDDEARGELMLTLMRAHRYPEAVVAARSYFATSPTMMAQQELAGALAADGHCDEALSQARSMVARYGNDPSRAQVNHAFPASVMAACGDVRGAQESLLDLTRERPDDWDAWFQLGNVLLLRGQTRHAIAAYRRAEAIGTEGEYLDGIASPILFQALAAHMGGSPPEKVEGLLQRVRAIPGGWNLFLRYWHLHVSLAMGRLEEASEVAAVARFDAPCFSQLLEAESARARGDLAMAVDGYASAATKLRPWIRAYALVQQARCLVDLSRGDEATPILVDAREEARSDDLPNATLLPVVEYLQGRVAEDEGANSAALEHYDKLLELWDDADICAPELDDARVRAAALRRALRS